MITTSDIATILYKDCKAFGISNVYKSPNVPIGDCNDITKPQVTAERIVILTKKETPEKIWKKSFVEVNLVVPNLKDGKANLSRTTELDRMAHILFGDVFGYFDNTKYTYSLYSTETLQDPDIKCNYVNVRILFQVLNVKL